MTECNINNTLKILRLFKTVKLDSDESTKKLAEIYAKLPYIGTINFLKNNYVPYGDVVDENFRCTLELNGKVVLGGPNESML